MVVARCNQSLTGRNAIAMLCFLYFDLTYLVQSLRKSCSENFGHVLHRDNARTICRHCPEDLRECFSPSSRSPNRDESVGGDATSRTLRSDRCPFSVF